MKPVNNNLTAEELWSLLVYDPNSGLFRWLARVGEDRSTKVFNAKYAGKLAGCSRANGHVTIKIHQQYFSASRLAWLYMTGDWPREEVDHEDTDTSNNRFGNLREATRSQNGANRRTHKNCASGVKGVYFSTSKGKWVAQAGGRKRRIVRYAATKDEAQALYAQAARELFGEFARAV